MAVLASIFFALASYTLHDVKTARKLTLLANSPLRRPREAKKGCADPKIPYPAKLRTNPAGH
jgi:hypothetical protein